MKCKLSTDVTQWKKIESPLLMTSSQSVLHLTSLKNLRSKNKLQPLPSTSSSTPASPMPTFLSNWTKTINNHKSLTLSCQELLPHKLVLPKWVVHIWVVNIWAFPRWHQSTKSAPSTAVSKLSKTCLVWTWSATRVSKQPYRPATKRWRTRKLMRRRKSLSRLMTWLTRWTWVSTSRITWTRFRTTVLNPLCSRLKRCRRTMRDWYRSKRKRSGVRVR